MQDHKKPRSNNIALLHILGAFVWLLFFFLAYHPKVAAEDFIQSYNTSGVLQQGLIVQLKSSTNTVSAASQSSAYQTFGVVVNAADAPVAFTSSSLSNQAYVASSGHYNLLVSDQNGPIISGSYVTLSSVNGVGMQDDSSEPIIVGQALASFNSSSAGVGTDTLKESNGSTKTVHLGLIPVNIGIAHNPLAAQPKSEVPQILQRFTVGVTGKNDPAWRVYFAFSVLLVIAVITTSMIYSAVRNSIISIGRNPLSKQAIRKGFIRVVISAMIIFLSGIFGVYLLLKV
jgi:hypothetical protein